MPVLHGDGDGDGKARGGSARLAWIEFDRRFRIVCRGRCGGRGTFAIVIERRERERFTRLVRGDAEIDATVATISRPGELRGDAEIDATVATISRPGELRGDAEIDAMVATISRPGERRGDFARRMLRLRRRIGRDHSCNRLVQSVAHSGALRSCGERLLRRGRIERSRERLRSAPVMPAP